MATPGMEDAVPTEDVLERLRKDLEKVKGDQEQVDLRKTELIQTVKAKIDALQKLLVQFGGATSAPAPATVMAKSNVGRPGVGSRKNETPIIEYVRQELARVGHEIKTPVLKQTLLTKYRVAPDRLKNLSQILFKASSVYKADGKVGLVEWKQRKQPAKPPAKRPVMKPAAGAAE